MSIVDFGLEASGSISDKALGKSPSQKEKRARRISHRARFDRAISL
jgi:hypothetical protein